MKTRFHPLNMFLSVVRDNLFPPSTHRLPHFHHLQRTTRPHRKRYHFISMFSWVSLIIVIISTRRSNDAQRAALTSLRKNKVQRASESGKLSSVSLALTSCSLSLSFCERSRYVFLTPVPIFYHFLEEALHTCACQVKFTYLSSRGARQIEKKI